MNCNEAQALITKYVQDQLDLKTLEEFLHHVNNCPDCLEELEVYYIVFMGIKRLDNDENIAIDYHEQFKQSLQQSALQIRRHHKIHLRRRLVFVGVLVFVMLASNYSLGKLENENTPLYRTQGSSDFSLTIQFTREVSSLERYIYDKLGEEFWLTPNTKYINPLFLGIKYPVSVMPTPTPTMIPETVVE